jgi:dTDP-4-dehydrorhamnose 3,5-epimerase-like enzyme
MEDPIQIVQLVNAGDIRGKSFIPPRECLEFIGSVRDIHIVSIVPGAVRGNHYHQHHREILFILYADQWSLHWDSGSGTEIRRTTFSGSGVVMVQIEPLASHAVRNDGNSELQMVGLSNLLYNPGQPDLYHRQVV